MSAAAMPSAEPSDALVLDDFRLLDGFGLDVEAALAEAGRPRANLYVASEIAGGRWPVARGLGVIVGSGVVSTTPPT